MKFKSKHQRLPPALQASVFTLITRGAVYRPNERLVCCGINRSKSKGQEGKGLAIRGNQAFAICNVMRW
jgi:hypothetical protein